MCIDFDGHHSDGSSFVYVYDIWILLYIKKKQVKGPSPVYGLAPRTRFGSANRVGSGIEA